MIISMKTNSLQQATIRVFTKILKKKNPYKSVHANVRSLHKIFKNPYILMLGPYINFKKSGETRTLKKIF